MTEDTAAEPEAPEHALVVKASGPISPSRNHREQHAVSTYVSCVCGWRYSKSAASAREARRAFDRHLRNPSRHALGGRPQP